MSGVMGSTVVNLGLNNSKFKKGLTESQGGLKSFASSAVSFINPVTAGFAAITAGAIGVGASIWGLTDRIGKLAGVADKAAQTGLSGKFLQQLEFAADQSGVSAEALTGGIKKLTVLIGKAADGSKEAASSLAAFGLNAEELKSLSPEAQFMRIAEKIGQIPTASGRASAAVKLFGRSGIEMTTLFAGGLNDITKLMQDAEDIGIGLDAAGLAKAAAADDAIQKMKASFGSMLDQITVGVAPAFEQFATYISGLNGPIAKVIEKFNELPDKVKFLGDVTNATFDFATESIKAKWDVMLLDMLHATKDFAKDIAWNLANPFGGAGAAAGAGLNMGANAGNAANLAEAEKKLDAILNQIRPDAPFVGPKQQFPFVGPQMPEKADGTKLRGLVDDIWNKVSPIADAAKFAAQGAFDRTKIKAGAMMGTLENIFSGEKKTEDKKIEPRLAGAMQAGSQEAYSTIVQAMIRQKDPVVKATQDQTKTLVKAIKSQPATRLAYVAAFEGVGQV